MSSTVRIDPRLLARAAEMTGIQDPDKLVSHAVESLLRSGAIERMGGAMPDLKERMRKLDELQPLLVPLFE